MNYPSTESPDYTTLVNVGCLPGAELEDDGGPGTAESHFEKRVFGNELMTGIVGSDVPVLSSFTLALCQDSGWYQVDYEQVLDPDALLFSLSLLITTQTDPTALVFAGNHSALGSQQRV